MSLTIGADRCDSKKRSLNLLLRFYVLLKTCRANFSWRRSFQCEFEEDSFSDLEYQTKHRVVSLASHLPPLPLLFLSLSLSLLLFLSPLDEYWWFNWHFQNQASIISSLFWFFPTLVSLSLSLSLSYSPFSSSSLSSSDCTHWIFFSGLLETIMYSMFVRSLRFIFRESANLFEILVVFPQSRKQEDSLDILQDSIGMPLNSCPSSITLSPPPSFFSSLPIFQYIYIYVYLYIFFLQKFIVGFSLRSFDTILCCPFETHRVSQCKRVLRSIYFHCRGFSFWLFRDNLRINSVYEWEGAGWKQVSCTRWFDDSHLPTVIVHYSQSLCRQSESSVHSTETESLSQ